MRSVEEMVVDMNLALGCMLNRHSCNKQCEKCDYINYDKNYPKLRQEIYLAYQNCLEIICNAGRDEHCMILQQGDTVYENDGFYCEICKKRHERVVEKVIGKDVFLSKEEALKGVSER